jgi:esterase
MKAIELGFDRIEGAHAEKTVVLLHGILGSGPNLRAVAKRFVEACPEWSAWLVDLRGHGRSPKGTPGGTITAAAEDVLALSASASGPLSAVVGHSFGGKVALEALRLQPGLSRVVMIDSNPGAREPLRGGDSAPAVLETIEALPKAFANKREFTAAVEARHGRSLAQWLAMSTVEDGGRVRFALDLAEIRALLQSYFETDLWSVVESPPPGAAVHLVIGERSSSFSPADRERASRIAASEPRVTVDVLPTDHWVHVEDPDGLQRVLALRLGGRS